MESTPVYLDHVAIAGPGDCVGQDVSNGVLDAMFPSMDTMWREKFNPTETGEANPISAPKGVFQGQILSLLGCLPWC